MPTPKNHRRQPPTMSGEQLRAIRNGLDLTEVQFGNAIGYAGQYDTVRVSISQYERGLRDIPPWIATRARALDRDGLLVFIRSYRGADDQVEFVRRLSLYLTEGAPAP